METFVIDRLSEAASGLISAKESSDIPAVRRHCIAALREIEQAIKLAAALTDEDVADAGTN